ncbi:MAG: alkaline phosphatase [Lentisphaeria bacterium]|nr:alkaline phosphatase [Lentisphaeria bacterium]
MRRYRALRYVWRGWAGCALWLACLWGLHLGAAPPARNVILMIPDGCSTEALTLARWCKGAPLAFDGACRGMIRTYIADSVVADSAPMATAYASGCRTSDKHIGIGPKPETLSTVPAPPGELVYRPVATVLEGARLLGKATGLVATSVVSHATPAAFVAHVPQRSQMADIMEQAVHSGVDVVFGGGRKYLLPIGNDDGVRSDGLDLEGVLRARGYRVLSDTGDAWAELAKGPPGAETARVFGLFAAGDMAPEPDRYDVAPGEPSLDEMTRNAIALLSRDPEGFFLMVEGSQIDWACHANDPAHLVGDLLAFDRAVQTALDFARDDGHTLVIVCSDHNTGGVTIGNAGTSKSYSQMPAEALLGPIRGMTRSAGYVWTQAQDPALLRRTADALAEGTGVAPPDTVVRREALRAAVLRYWGLGIPESEAREILERAAAYGKSGYYALGEVISRHHTAVGWTTHGHTGGDVALFAFGPGAPLGLLDAPEVARAIADAMGLDLDRLNERLFVCAQTAFPGQVHGGGKDGDAGPGAERRVVRIRHGGRTAELPVNRNLLILDGREIPLEGLVIHVPPTGRTFLPMQAVQLIRGEAPDLPAVAR